MKEGLLYINDVAVRRSTASTTVFKITRKRIVFNYPGSTLDCPGSGAYTRECVDVE